MWVVCVAQSGSEGYPAAQTLPGAILYSSAFSQVACLNKGFKV